MTSAFMLANICSSTHPLLQSREHHSSALSIRRNELKRKGVAVSPGSVLQHITAGIQLGGAASYCLCLCPGFSANLSAWKMPEVDLECPPELKAKAFVYSSTLGSL